MSHPVKKGTHQKGRHSMQARLAPLLKTGNPLWFSSFSPLGSFLGAANLCPPGCDTLPSSQSLLPRDQTRGGWFPKLPSRFLFQNLRKLTKAHDQEKVRRPKVE